jgi:hypothetical protein
LQIRKIMSYGCITLYGHVLMNLLLRLILLYLPPLDNKLNQYIDFAHFFSQSTELPQPPKIVKFRQSPSTHAPSSSILNKKNVDVNQKPHF